MEDLTVGRWQEAVMQDITGFTDFLRRQGFRVGLTDSRAALDVLKLAHDVAPDQILRSVYAKSVDEWARFPSLWHQYFESRSPRLTIREMHAAPAPTGFRDAVPQSVGTPGVRQALFAYHPDYGSETDLMPDRHLPYNEWRSWTQRLFIRWQAEGLTPNPPVGFRIDWPRTTRLGLRHAGEVVRFERAHLRPRLPSVLWVIDVSGSMRTYTPFFLGLAWHFARVGAPVHALLSATESLWVTPLLRRWRPGHGPWARPEVLGGGTRLGQALERVVRDFGSRIDGSTIVVIVSDGFDTGKLDILHRHLAWIRQRARRMIWMNPLLSVPGYIPQSQALHVALPLVTEHVGIWDSSSWIRYCQSGFD